LINYSQTQPVAIEIHRKNKNQTNLKTPFGDTFTLKGVLCISTNTRPQPKKNTVLPNLTTQ